ncbi:MAG: D-2-hydroxyacid dehydrogenase [Clostridia bacterium]|nr:D-2-hydroxyacid dehydrogenase [Clostridia bacterium]
MHTVILDGHAANPGDLSWDFLDKFGTWEVYAMSPPYTVVERAKNADIIILNKTPITRGTVEQLPKLKFITLLATGYNVIDVDACREHGVLVANVPSYSESAVAQQAFAFILEYANRVGSYSASVAAGDWTNCGDFTYQKDPLCELMGKTIGIVGFGKIGRRVAALARAFEMRVLVHTAHPEKYPGAQVEFLALDELLPQADFVTIHCPLTPATDKMVNEDFISKMKDGAFFVNTARGGEVDDEALAQALNSGKLSGAGIDVMLPEPPGADHVLLHAKNVFITPHIAWAAFETRKRLLKIVEENIATFIAGNPQNVVNN